jgi:hypothetical protein
MHDVTWRRTLLRVGLLGSACWIAWWVWHYATTCDLVGMHGARAIACRWESTTADGAAVMTRTAPALSVLGEMAVRTIGVPALVIVAAVVACWVIERFSGLAR